MTRAQDLEFDELATANMALIFLGAPKALERLYEELQDTAGRHPDCKTVFAKLSFYRLFVKEALPTPEEMGQ